MKIDSHVHLPVVSENRTLEQSKQVLLSDLDRHQVDYAIVIPDNVPGSPIGDVETCLNLLEGEQRLFMLGTIDVERQGEEWLHALEDMAKNRRIVGMKIFPGHDPIYPTDSRLSPVYQFCQTYGLPMVIHTGWNSNQPEVARYNDPKYIVQVAERYPSLSIVIAHYFWPEVEYCYHLTHSYPNILYDTSGLADDEVIRETGLDRITKVLKDTLAVSPDRVLFGTDYAMCDIQCHVDLVCSLSLSEEEEEGVLWKNAVRVFGLPIAL